MSIFVKGTTISSITDFDGKYSIAAKEGDIIVYNFIGYISSNVKITKNNIYTIVLTEDSSSLDEVVVTGYGTSKRRADNDEEMDMALSAESKLSGVVPGIQIRGAASIDSNSKPLIIVDGIPFNGKIEDIDQNNILSINVLKNSEATALYGTQATNGVIVIATKTGQAALSQELSQVKARTNFNETAFFYPNLRTDENGNMSFSFTTPEALTQWKLQLLAHTKTLQTATKTLTTVTQKELMVIPKCTTIFT